MGSRGAPVFVVMGCDKAREAQFQLKVLVDRYKYFAGLVGVFGVRGVVGGGFLDRYGFIRWGWL